MLYLRNCYTQTVAKDGLCLFCYKSLKYFRCVYAFQTCTKNVIYYK